MLYTYFAVLCAVLCAVSAVAETATTRVVAVMSDGVTSVQLEAGTAQGLQPGVSVEILREGEHIVHPLSGAVLGVPQEPVGTAEVRRIDNGRAVAVMTKTYSTPRIGDMVEFEPMYPPSEEKSEESPAAVAQVIERVRGLEKDIESYQKTQKTISAYPVFAQQVWDEMGAIKSYLVTIDERLIALEAQQGEDRQHLAQALREERGGQDAREVTIRYDEDTDVRLQIAGKTLVISVENDSLHLEEIAVDTVTAVSLDDVQENATGDWAIDYGSLDLDFDGEFLESPWVLGGIFVFIFGLTGIAIYIIKRRYDDVMGDLDDYDQDFSDEDFDEDFDDEFEDDEFEDDESDGRYGTR
jgi:hypothetical protein